MVKAISVCRRRSTGSVFQLEIPSEIIGEAIEIVEQEQNSDMNDQGTNEEVAMHLLRYIATQCPNAGDWDIQVEPLFAIVNDGDDLDTMEDKEDYKIDII